MKYLALLTMIFIAVAASGQEGVVNNNAVIKGKFLFGISFSPDYCYRTLVNNNGDRNAARIIASRNNHEIGKLGYTTGLNSTYFFSEKFGLAIGAQLSNKGYRNRTTTLVYSNPASSSFIGGDEGYYMLDVRYNDYSLDIPLLFNYLNGRRKVKFVAGVGLTTNILIRETIVFKLTSKDERSTTKRKSVNPYIGSYNEVFFTPSVAAGINYTISDKFHARAMAAYRHAITSLVDAPIYGYLYNSGLDLSFHYVINH